MIKINFEDTYDPIEVAKDFSFMTFNTIDTIGGIILIKIKITPLESALLPKVSNLSFGPLMANGHINDTVKVHHQNIEKVFSTYCSFIMYF
jgi:hypothetical protein